MAPAACRCTAARPAQGQRLARAFVRALLAGPPQLSGAAARSSASRQAVALLWLPCPRLAGRCARQQG